MWTSFFYALSAFVCVFCLIGCARIAQRVQADSVSLAAEVRLNASRVRSLTESHELTMDELKNLANRVKMQRVRNAADHATKPARAGSDMPDPFTDPDGWRTAMNKRIAAARLNGGTP